MERIGLVVAVEEEAIGKVYGAPLSFEKVGGFDVNVYRRYGKEIIVIKSGMGSILASAATMVLIVKYHVDAILNFGIVGAMSEEFASQSVTIVKRLVDYEMDVSEIDHIPLGQHEGFASKYLELDKKLIEEAKAKFPSLPLSTLASGNVFLVGEEKKKKHDLFNADICDMELAGIAYVAANAGIPVFSIKCVADGLLGDGKEYYREKKKASDLCFAVLDSILKE
ncbi:MAG: 5'-methylthioadenosine/S-adenosylhomocysteine nucleosidase [Bacilli bacterium]|nr:5'-methylthioadenosine/S-adenosylhomocysteine nucleosidase [Bacilli bacterium]